MHNTQEVFLIGVWIRTRLCHDHQNGKYAGYMLHVVGSTPLECYSICSDVISVFGRTWWLEHAEARTRIAGTLAGDYPGCPYTHQCPCMRGLGSKSGSSSLCARERETHTQGERVIKGVHESSQLQGQSCNNNSDHQLIILVQVI